MAQRTEGNLLRPSAQSTSGWTTEHKSGPDIGDVGIFVKSKTTNISTTLPKELYLTHIYRLTIRCSGKLATMNNIFVKVYLLNSLSKDEITKDGKPAIEINSGSSSVELTHGEASIKVKFIDTSYHHGKTDFCLRVSILEQSDDEPLDLISKLSVPFKVYSKKRSATPQQSRRIRDSPSTSTSLFLRYLEDPYTLSPGDRETVREMFVSKTPVSDLPHLLDCIQQISHSRDADSQHHPNPNPNPNPHLLQSSNRYRHQHINTIPPFSHSTGPPQASSLASLAQQTTKPPEQRRQSNIESLLGDNQDKYATVFPHQSPSGGGQIARQHIVSHGSSSEHQGFNLPPLRYLQHPQGQTSGQRSSYMYATNPGPK